MPRTTTLVFLACALLALGPGCSPDLIGEKPRDPDGPLLQTEWAVRARAVRSSSMPKADDPRVPQASWTEDGELEEDDFEDVPRSPDGQVTVRLKADYYDLQESILIQGADLVVRGEGPHKTILALDTESLGAIAVAGARKVVFEDLTILGLRGGGIRVKAVDEVVFARVHVAGARFGLDAESSNVRVVDSVFEGCQEGLSVKGGELDCEGSTFSECWVACRAGGVVRFEGSVFVDNRDTFKGRLDFRDRVVSCLFAGETQFSNWEGKPGEARGNLVTAAEIDEGLFEKGENRILWRLDDQDFPGDIEGAIPPEGFAPARVHLALMRQRLRGEDDPPDALLALAIDQARIHAEKALELEETGQEELATRSAALAMTYVGDYPLDNCPPAIRDAAQLALRDDAK